MPAQDPRQPPWIDPDPGKTTRREALSEALRPGPHPEEPRAFSTLVSAASGPYIGQDECAYCDALLRACVSHLTGHTVLDDYGSSYEALLAAVLAFPSQRVLAGGTDSNGDEVEHESGPVPNSPACAQEKKDEAAQQE